MPDPYHDISDLASLDLWMRASAEGYNQAVSVFLRPRILAARGDDEEVLRRLAHELLDTTEDEGVTASMLLLEAVGPLSLKERVAQVAEVCEALVAALDSQVPVVRRRALAALANVSGEMRDEGSLVEPLLTKILPLFASADEDTVGDALSIVGVLLSDERHRVGFVRMGGLPSLYHLLDAAESADQRMARGIIEWLLVSPLLVEDDALREALDTARVVLAASWAGPRAVT
jgi:hypothetical protein